MKQRGGTGAIALVLSLGLLLAACGTRAETGGPSQGPAPAPVPDGKPREKCTPEPTAGEAVKDEFIYVFNQNPTSLDKDKMTNPSGTLHYIAPIFDGLLTTDADGKIVPSLAKEYKVSDDGNTLELKLIENWKFHDGEPFNAQAVKLNIERGQQMKAYNSVALKAVKEIVVVDNYTVRLITDGTAGSLFGLLTDSAGMMMSPAKFNAPNQDTLPTGGSGPYKLVSYTPDVAIVYEAVPNYWRPNLPRSKKVTIRIIRDDNARLNAMITGQIDAMGLRAPMVAPAKAAGIKVCVETGTATYPMVLNAARGDLANADIRKAIHLAIDRKAIVDSLEGYCLPTVQVYNEGNPAHNPNVKPLFDPAEAKKLIAKSGIAKPTFELIFINAPLYQAFAEIIKQNLEAVGFVIPIRGMPYVQMVDEFSINKQLDAILIPQSGAAHPSDLAGQYFSKDGFNNPGGVSSPEIEKLLADGLRAKGDAVAPIYQKLSQLAYELPSPVIVLCNQHTISGVKAGVSGFYQYAYGITRFDTVGAKK